MKAQHHKHALDFVGVFTLVGWVVPLLLGLTLAPVEGMTSPQVMLYFGLSIAMFLAFILAETRTAEPIVPLTLFANPVVAVSCLSLLMVGIGMFGAILFIPLYFQSVMGASASESGYLMIPMMLMITILSVVSGQLISRTGHYKWVALSGIGVLAAGNFLLSKLSINTPMFAQIAAMVTIGSGLGLLMPVYTLASQNAVPQKMIGVVTGVTQFFRSIGGTLGAAVFNSILLLKYREYLGANLPNETSPQIRAVLDNPLRINGGEHAAAMNPLQGVPSEVISVIKQGLVLALDAIFLSAAFIMVACFLLNLFLKELPLRRHPENVPAAPADAEIVAS
jgi:MFS family permease